MLFLLYSMLPMILYHKGKWPKTERKEKPWEDIKGVKEAFRTDTPVVLMTGCYEPDRQTWKIHFTFKSVAADHGYAPLFHYHTQ
jgi:hypothetical protein